MNTSIQPGRIQGQTLKQYVASHPQQDDEVAATVQDTCLSIVDYVKRSLAGEKQADPRTAFRLMDELRDGLVETKKVPERTLGANQTSVNAWLEGVNANRQGDVDGKPFELEGERDVKTQGGVTEPEGTTSRPYGPNFNRDRSTYIDSTLTYGPEQARVYEFAGSSYHRVGAAVTEGRHGLGSAIAEVDLLTPLIQASLANRAVQMEQIAHYSETSSSHLSTASVGQVEARRGFLGGARLDGGVASSFDLSSDRSVQYSSEPALVDAFKGLQGLRDMFENMKSFPSESAMLTAQRPVTEEVHYVTAAAPQERKFFQLRPVAEPAPVHTTEAARFTNSRDTSETMSRNLGLIPWSPAYIDIKAT